MSYNLAFLPSALKEWGKLDQSIQNQFKKKLTERLENPRVPADCLRGHANHYKIKLRSSAYRLVYEAEDETLRVIVIAVGHRSKGRIYRALKEKTKQ